MKKTIVYSLLTVSMLIFMLLYPQDSINASKSGLMLWFHQVLPTLLPFMICVHILNALGFVRYIGRLFAPIMEPLFGVGGKGCFALAAGMISGYPMGAKITCDMRRANELTQTEAQRLLCFTNNAGPLFILGVIGTGIFKSRKIGGFLLMIHLISAILTGLLFHAYGMKKENYKQTPEAVRRGSYSSDCPNQQPIGSILGMAVTNSIETITLIGGFIILFSILSQWLKMFIALPNPLLKEILTGLLEITNGVSGLANLGAVPAKIKILAAAGLISFGGFSIHAQSAALISKTDLKISVYLLAKAIQSALCMLLGYFFYPYLS